MQQQKTFVAAKPALREANPAIDKPGTPPGTVPNSVPEPKRSKSERVHEGRGYAGGLFHGAMLGIAIGLTTAFLAFSMAAPTLADLTSRLIAIQDARAHLGR